MEVRIDQVSIETCLWHIHRYLIDHHGYYQAEQDMAPLNWYVITGRATINFLRKLMSAKPFMVARKLHEGGSYDEVIDRVKEYIKYDEEEN